MSIERQPGDAPPDPTSSGEAPVPASASDAAADGSESVTPSGYSYTVVDDDAEQAAPANAGDGGGHGVRPLWLVAAIVVPAALVAVAVWFLASSLNGGSSNHRANADVASVLNLVSGGEQAGVAKRYEGTLAPGFPSDIPSYPGAKLVSSIRQIRGDDALYLAVYDTTDARQKVATYFGDKFDSDPWQLQAGQDSRDSTLHQFSRVDSSDVSGIVLLAQSTDDNVTTILLSISQVGGAKDAPQTTFSSDGSPSLPDGFPSDVPQYPGGTVVQSAFQKQSAGNTYLASFVTKDGADDALTYYRNAFQGSGWTVQDSDASQSSLKDAKAIQFTDGASKFSGDVTVGQFAEDTSYTRVDVQVQVAKASGG